nr:RecName: Full=Unknown protein 1 from 2D-PAGE [Fructilactobacillus sanfranciscensis]
GYGFLTTDD